MRYAIGVCGTKVPLAPYATYGTQDLAANIVESIGTCNAVLLANHGLITVGPDIASAFAATENIEFVARVYYQAKCIGKPIILSEPEMQSVIEKFKTYGQ